MMLQAVRSESMTLVNTTKGEQTRLKLTLAHDRNKNKNGKRPRARFNRGIRETVMMMRR